MKLARRALVERSTSWLDEPAIWSFEWRNIANIHEAARRALDERSSSQLVEPASSCKRDNKTCVTAYQLAWTVERKYAICDEIKRKRPVGAAIGLYRRRQICV